MHVGSSTSLSPDWITVTPPSSIDQLFLIALPKTKISLRVTTATETVLLTSAKYSHTYKSILGDNREGKCVWIYLTAISAIAHDNSVLSYHSELTNRLIQACLRKSLEASFGQAVDLYHKPSQVFKEFINRLANPLETLETNKAIFDQLLILYRDPEFSDARSPEYECLTAFVEICCEHEITPADDDRVLVTSKRVVLDLLKLCINHEQCRKDVTSLLDKLVNPTTKKVYMEARKTLEQAGVTF